jgi:hypothetical protein
MCIHQEHYAQLLALYPALPELPAKEVIPVASQPMQASITVKHRGESFLRVEIAFLYHANGKLIPDHKMLLRVDLYERKAVPESIWFQGRGTQHAKQPKEPVNEQIVNVIARRLDDWLNTLAASSATAH